MNAFGEFPSPRDPFDSSPRFDLFGAFAFVSVLVLCVGMYFGLYARTSRFELPDVFGTKAQETANKLLSTVALPTAAPIPADAPEATPGPKTIVPVVPGEAAEAAITIPFGIGAQGAQPAQSAAAPQPDVQAAPTAVPLDAGHAAGSRHRVTNTNGDGVFLRREAGSNDKIRAWPDNTVLEFQGDAVQVQGAGWAKMKDPAGNVGWVPIQYLKPDTGPAPAPAPAAQPAVPQPAPAAQPAAPAPAPQPAVSSGVQTVPIAPAPAQAAPRAPAPQGIITQPIARPAAPRP